MEYAVKINLYRGKKTFDENGKLSSEMSSIDLPTYNSLEWNNFMNNATIVGYTGGEVVSVNEIKYTTKEKPNGRLGEVVITTSYDPVNMDTDIVSEISNAVKRAFEPKRAQLSPQDQEIADLKATVAELVSSKKESKPKVENKPEAKSTDDADELDSARARYTELFGKKPSHMSKLKGLLSKIADKENESAQ